MVIRAVLLRALGWSGITAGMIHGGQVAVGTEVAFSLPVPTLDRWNYPFNQTPGFRPTASVWGAFLEDGLSPDFDNRDAQFHVGFDTSAHVEPGLGPEAYTVMSARVTVMVAEHETFTYDPTFDLWQTYLPEADPQYMPDTTPGRPAELFGVGFRHGFDALTYQESTAYSPMGPFGKGHRTTYAMDLPSGTPRDVSNNVDEGFDPLPFAIGTTDAVAPGQLVPSGAVFTFEIEVTDEHIQNYLREALHVGRAHFMVASLFPASPDFTGAFPQFYCKENLLVIKGFADAAGLEMTVVIDQNGIVGDLNGDGVVDVSDLLILLGAWGPCDDGESCAADLNGDGSVDVSDLLILLGNWG